MFSDYRVIMIPECKTLFLTSSIIRYNSNGDLPSVLPNNSEFLLNIPVSDSSVVAVDSDISYRGGTLAFLIAVITSRSSSYLILCSRCYSTFYS